MPRDSSWTREESPAILVQEPRVGSSSKEPIPLDNEEEQVDYGHDDTDTNLTKPEDADHIGDVEGLDDEYDFEAVGEAMSTPFPVSGGFKLVIDFASASSILVSTPTFEMTEAPAPAPASLIW
ncbi:uncharacterized protein A4U43_C04F20880 [Asparagus officinalis]|uniref:Uncharacterized protein n=1 Tax=Asparagus officinalis TaxID=4686 RepID=A0A5P1F780_ASPOF|nr:uncharacterized protein A4U43_C04F20880 [Asparagus officinalis]